MPRLYMISVSGLDVKSDWRVIHDRLLDQFPRVDDVLPTTTPETLLIVYRGRAHVDEWLEVLSEGVVRPIGAAEARNRPARRRAPRSTSSARRHRK